MALIDREGSGIGFKNVELLKDQILGIGSFGAVYKAKCGGLICAAKIIHPTLVDPYIVLTQHIPHHGLPQHFHRRPSRRFEAECEFLSIMRHPNIVQFLGFCHDRATELPVILMELMDDSLTNFVGECVQPVPFHVQVDLCYDITLALSYLHSNDIIHRDLSGNNVLLVGNYRAKVTDFGMARLHDQRRQLTGQSLTMCPGTDVYMPPEAVESSPHYNEKIDCFSFGVIVLQMLTRQFPKPGERRQKVNLDHPGLPAGTLEVRVSEIDRRQNHIMLVDPNLLLLPVVFACLRDSNKERPSSDELCDALGALKRDQEYAESVKMITEKDRHDTLEKEKEIESLTLKLEEQTQSLEGVSRQLEERELTLTTMKREIVLLDQQLEQEMLEKEQITSELNHITSELEAGKQVIAEFQQRFGDLKPVTSKTLQKESIKEEYYNLDLDTSDKLTTCRKNKSNVTLNWCVGKNSPVAMCRWCDAVVDGTMVYFKRGYSPKVIAYDSTEDSWCDVVDCCYQDCTLCIVNNLLTTVGGWNSNQLFSLARQISNSATATSTCLNDASHWSEVYPPMPTRRCWTTCFSNKSVLLVAGGQGVTVEDKALRTVEVLDLDSMLWSTASSLPCGVKMASALLSNDHLYLLGGRDECGKPRTTSFQCHLAALLGTSHVLKSSPCKETVHSPAFDANIQDEFRVWCEIAPLPLADCAFVTIADHILSVGGRQGGSEDDSYSTAVNLYLPLDDSWELVSNMTLSRSSCFSVALPNNRLMVVGGMMIGDLCTKTVKFATILL